MTMQEYQKLPQPECPPGFRVERSDDVQIDGVWWIAWNLVEMTAEEIAAELAVWRANTVVSRFQARAALAGAGMLATVQAMMDDPATPEITRLAWEDAIEFRRMSPTVLGMAVGLGLTDAELDGLFDVAKGIEA